MREGVTVRNPKTDLKSEVGYLRYGATNRGSAREVCKPRVATWPARVGGRGPHGKGEPSAPVGPTRPPRGADMAARDLLGNLLLFPPFNQTSFPPTLMQFF